ncbi:MAG: DUF4493 domain-containing protein [Candidatus Krumholzibacteria bacterium]|nr:DUF4493 domain-containing protein [Candidatus Krumholzibacteria bacterium]
MRRAMLMMISAVLMLSFFSSGCKDDSQEASETGLRIVTDGCIEFGIYIHIDDEPQGMISSLEPANILLPAGTYELFARSNAAWNGNELCWTGQYTVSDGSLTTVTLTCSEEQFCGD